MAKKKKQQNIHWRLMTPLQGWVVWKVEIKTGTDKYLKEQIFLWALSSPWVFRGAQKMSREKTLLWGYQHSFPHAC